METKTEYPPDLIKAPYISSSRFYKNPPKPINGVEIIAAPESFPPFQNDLQNLGVFNPGVTTIKEGGLDKILISFRVAVAPNDCPLNQIKLPHFSVENHDNSPPRIDFDLEDIKSLKEITEKDVTLANNTKRLSHISYQLMAKSLNGSDFDWQEVTPSFYPKREHTRFGLEDARITRMSKGHEIIYEGNKYDYVITIVSPHREKSVSTTAFFTNDFKTLEILKPVPKNIPDPSFKSEKDIPFFPEKINISLNGEKIPCYTTLRRPSDFRDISIPGIDISFSPDLKFWSTPSDVLESEHGETLGPGPPPIKIIDEKLGPLWLSIFHEVHNIDQKNHYLGALSILNYKEPWNVLHRSKPIIFPNQHNRPPGFVPNVTYPSGIVIRDGISLIYSGEDDTYTSIRKFYLEDLINHAIYN